MSRFFPLPLALLLLALGASGGEAQVFTGAASTASDPFSLSEGVVLVEMEHRGTGAFRARILDAEGAVTEELASANGAFTGSRALRVPRSGRYLLDVVADGEWRVALRPFAEAAGPDLEGHPELAEAGQAGRSHADEPGVAGWFGGGFLAGLTTGPVGAVVVTRMAGGRDRELTQAARAHLSDRTPVYSQAFTETYEEALRTRRQRAALRGSLLGTAALGAVLIRYTNLARPGAPDDGGHTPDLVGIPLLRIPVGF